MNRIEPFRVPKKDNGWPPFCTPHPLCRKTSLPHLILYGTSGCHLCEEAALLLREASARTSGNLEWEEVDIAQTPELMARYGVRIPVLHCRDSEEELDWPFDGEQITAFLLTLRAPSPD